MSDPTLSDIDLKTKLLELPLKPTITTNLIRNCSKTKNHNNYFNICFRFKKVAV